MYHSITIYVKKIRKHMCPPYYLIDWELWI